MFCEKPWKGDTRTRTIKGAEESNEAEEVSEPKYGTGVEVE